MTAAAVAMPDAACTARSGNTLVPCPGMACTLKMVSQNAHPTQITGLDGMAELVRSGLGKAIGRRVAK